MEKLSSMDEQFLSMINKIIEENIDNENFSVNDLAEKARLSRSMLHRKLKKLTGKSSIELITEIRLLKAKELLENNVATASEIAYMVGFSEPSYFNKVFKKYFKISPGEVKKQGLHKKLNKKRWYIIIPVFIIVLIPILFFILRPFSDHQNEPEKTIAVLPFVDFSPEKGNEYIIYGLMEEILDKLEKIGDLKVKSRTDVEKYKNTDRSTREIGRELNVNYLLEGSGQKISDKIKLSIQLIETSSGNHIFSKIFTEDICTKEVYKKFCKKYLLKRFVLRRFIKNIY